MEVIMKYEIPDSVINNLKVFLNRVNLNGNEVPAFIEIISALDNPISEDDKNDIQK